MLHTSEEFLTKEAFVVSFLKNTLKNTWPYSAAGLLAADAAFFNPDESPNPLRGLADRTIGYSINPYTWFGGQHTPMTMAENVKRRIESINASQRAKIQAAIDSGDFEAASRLIDEFNTGNVSTGWRIFGGTRLSNYQAIMGESIGKLQQQRNTVYSFLQNPMLNNAQREVLKARIADLDKKIAEFNTVLNNSSSYKPNTTTQTTSTTTTSPLWSPNFYDHSVVYNHALSPTSGRVRPQDDIWNRVSSYGYR